MAQSSAATCEIKRSAEHPTCVCVSNTLQVGETRGGA